MAARGSTPKRRPVWVDKKQFPSLTSAAAFLSEKTDCKFYPASHPTRVRGLKLKAVMDSMTAAKVVASHAGAWIET